MFLGILGGLLGSGFTHLNLVFARSRKKFMSGIKVIFFPSLRYSFKKLSI